MPNTETDWKTDTDAGYFGLGDGQGIYRAGYFGQGNSIDASGFEGQGGDLGPGYFGLGGIDTAGAQTPGYFGQGAR